MRADEKLTKTGEIENTKYQKRTCASERKDVFTKIDRNLFPFEKKILLLLMRDTATKRIISLVI